MKKIKSIRMLIVFLSALLIVILNFYWLTLERKREEEEKAAWLEEHFYFETLSFRVEGAQLPAKVRGWRDWVGDRLYIFLPSFAAGQPLRMDFSFADRVVVDGKAYESGSLLSEYELNREYPVSFEDENGVQESCTMVLLCSQNLPAVFVTTDSGGMDAVNADKLNQESGMFCLIGPDGSRQSIQPLTYIKGRGNTTWGQDKKPYSIKLAGEADILGMGSARRWELLANAYDGSHMRNQLVFDMAREAGMDYTPQSAWVDLYLNGSYQGLYQLTEKVQAEVNRVDIANQDKGQGNLTGGYLFLMEDGGRYETAVSRFTTAGGQTMVIKSPEQTSEQQTDYLSALVQEFEDAICSPDGGNPQTDKEFTEYIDLDSFASKYLVEEISKNSDAVTNSQYFYKQPDYISPLLYAGPVWDYDNALGHTNEEAMDPVGLMLDKTRSDDGTSNLWYASLCSQPVFMDRVRELYRDTFSVYLKKMAETGIDEWRELLRVPATLDWIRWKDTNKDFRYKVCDSYDGYVDYLKGFLQERIAFLDSVYIEGTEYRRIRFDRGGPFSYVDLYTQRGESGRTAPDSSDIEWEGERITGWYYEDGTEYDPSQPVWEDETVYARWEPAADQSETQEDDSLAEEAKGEGDTS